MLLVQHDTGVLNEMSPILLLVFPICMAFAAANDLFTMTIPNKISLVLISAFFATALYAGLPADQILIHAGVGTAALVAGFTLFAFNLFGGGDAKLLAAGALWMGADFAIPFVAYITIFGGVLSVAILAYRRFVPAHSLPLPGWAMRLHTHGGGIPYGIAIAAAGLAIYPNTPLFLALAA